MYSTEKVLKLLAVISFICLPASLLQAQSFDYEHQPTFDFKFTEAQIDLQVNPEEGLINGAVTYNLEANISGADTLELDALGIQVDSVQSQGQTVSFTTEGELLKIALTDSSQMGNQYKVRISYQARPQFGLLKSSEGTMWTSLLPRSNRHWVPVKDHPRIEMTTTLSLQIPAKYTAFASGVRTDREVLSTSSKKVTFRTGRPIPVTALTFGFGQFREEGTSMGIKRINSYAETGSVRGQEQGQLVDQATQLLGEIEQSTGVEYPYQRLNIVVLNDHYGEQKPYGASTIYVYKNRGDLLNQLRRGLYGQWFGVFQREEQWAASWPVHLMQTALHFSLRDTAALVKANGAELDVGSSTVYDQFSAERWNNWQQSKISQSSNSQLSKGLVPTMLQQGPGTITPDTFKNTWYDMSGQPAVTMANFISPEPSTNRSVTGDTLRYRVDYNVDQTSNLLTLRFSTQEGSLQQSVTLPLNIMSGSGTDNAEITFSGTSDSVSVNLPAGTRGAYLAVPESQALMLEEHKAVPFLLYQLRNAETTEARKRAALGLGNHTDNPDLQLALNDVMQQQMAPEVEAALLRSYGKITAGADGTQQRFLEALQSSETEVRMAALEVLGNYSDQSVTQRLQSLAENESNEKLSNKALKMYLQQVDSTAALQFTNTLVQQDTSGTKAIAAIGALGAKGNAGQAVKLAGYYIEPVYAYEVRRQALQTLLEYDDSAEAWKKRTEMLLNDYDPRIRLLTIRKLDQIPAIDTTAIMENHRVQEYDARVLGVMSRE